MQRLEVSDAVRTLYGPLGVKGLIYVTSVEQIKWISVLCLLCNMFLVDNRGTDFDSSLH